jgi:hypothetical protein
MTIASTETLMSLDQFAEILGIPPIHFAQGITAAYPDDAGCRSIWYQYSWMYPGKAGREELARAIAQAETLIAQLVGFWPAPKWLTETDQPYPRQGEHSDGVGLIYYPAMSTGRRKTVGAKWGHFMAGGRRKVDLIALGVPISFPVDLDHGMATITTTWPGAVASQVPEVAVFTGTDTSPNQQIRHLNVTIGAGGVVTIRGRASQFLIPTLWDTNAVIDGDAGASYLATVNLYRVYNSAEGYSYAPVEFLWQSRSCYYPSVAPLVGYGTLQAWNIPSGIVTPIPATWDATTSLWTAVSFGLGDEPHMLRMFYQAGWPLDPQGRVDEPFARAIAALATALLSVPICGCAQADKMSAWWQGYPEANDPVSFRQLECPWGAKRGMFEAYRLLSVFWGAAGSVSL